jgi:hypothetical protein
LILIITLAVTLTHHRPADVPYSYWLNLTDFPPMPTGVFTVIGPDNSLFDSSCIQPDTLWSCSLPKELQAANAPFAANRPDFIFQIQFDNDTQKLWDTTGETPPNPTPVQSSATLTHTDPIATSALANSIGQLNLTGAVAAVAKRDQSFAAGINPDPAPRSYQENWFLGNWTDGIVSANKGGEPTPFYMSVLTNINATAGPNLLMRRGSGTAGVNGGADNNSTSFNIPWTAPPPVLNPDGSGANAVLLAYPKQQPVRLYDRGLPTEHYGFYQYFNKTIYVTNINMTTTIDNTPVDANGGCPREQANFIINYQQMRYLVQIWTRKANTTELIGGLQRDNVTQPGTFPYPVTVTVDNHGGEPYGKGTYFRLVDQPGVLINDTFAKFIFQDLSAGGTLFNHPNASVPFNPSYGGQDGGTGGCKCGYTNFVGVNGN